MELFEHDGGGKIPHLERHQDLHLRSNISLTSSTTEQPMNKSSIKNTAEPWKKISL